jgi:hypothetical protein
MKIMSLGLLLVLYGLMLSIDSVSAQMPRNVANAAYQGPPGWRMVDRFYGFRFEITGDTLFEGKDFVNAVTALAEEMFCFGWIQESFRGTAVGEVRCSKKRGPEFQKMLEDSYFVPSAGVTQAHIKVYEDTKIRLHFTDFKILEKGRDTCFLDQPHQCAEFEEKGAPAQPGGEDRADL